MPKSPINTNNTYQSVLVEDNGNICKRSKKSKREEEEQQTQEVQQEKIQETVHETSDTSFVGVEVTKRKRRRRRSHHKNSLEAMNINIPQETSFPPRLCGF